jgi:hypothetical protein
MSVLSSEDLLDFVLSEENLQNSLVVDSTSQNQFDYAATAIVLKSLITKDYLSTQVNRTINQIFDLIEGKSDTVEMYLDLIPIKQEITGPKKEDIARILAMALPICAEGQNVKAEDIYVCRPDFVPEENFINNYVVPNLSILLNVIPDSIQLQEPLTLSDELQRSPLFFWQGSIAGTFNMAVMFLIGIAFVFWFLTGLIAGKNWRGKLMWLGWMLVIPAVIVLLSGVVLGGSLAANLIRFAVNQINLTEAGTLQILAQNALQSMSLTFANSIRTSFLMVGGIATAAAVVLIAWGAALKKTKKAPEPAPEISEETE